jgi:hypothetical protein
MRSQVELILKQSDARLHKLRCKATIYWLNFESDSEVK